MTTRSRASGLTWLTDASTAKSTLFPIDSSTGSDSGQKELGTAYTNKQIQQVLGLQTQLRVQGMLQNLGAVTEQEEYSGDGAKNKLVKQPHPAMGSIVEAMRRATVDPNRQTLDAFEDASVHVTSCVQDLLNSLTAGEQGLPAFAGRARSQASASQADGASSVGGASSARGSTKSGSQSHSHSHHSRKRRPMSECSVQVWRVDAAGLRPLGANTPLLAVGEVLDNVFHMYGFVVSVVGIPRLFHQCGYASDHTCPCRCSYVSNRHPNPAEAVLHCYLKECGYHHVSQTSLAVCGITWRCLLLT